MGWVRFIALVIVMTGAALELRAAPNRPTPLPVILDMDGAAADVASLLMLLRHSGERLRLIGVTTVRGSASAHQAAINARRVMKLARLDDEDEYGEGEDDYDEIPIVVGDEFNSANVPIEDPILFNGHDGLSDVPQKIWSKWLNRVSYNGGDAGAGGTGGGRSFGDFSGVASGVASSVASGVASDVLGVVEEDEMIDSKKSGPTPAEFLVAASKMFKGRLVILAVGPLTNLAKAIEMDEEFVGRLKMVSIMGGNYFGEGNANAAAEFNFWADPLAAHHVLEKLHPDRTLIFGWEFCKSYSIPWQEWFNTLNSLHTRVASSIAAFDSNGATSNLTQSAKIFVDELAAAAILWPELVLEKQSLFATVERKGEYTTGMMVLDENGMLERKPNVAIVLGMDWMEFRKRILDTFSVGNWKKVLIKRRGRKRRG